MPHNRDWLVSPSLVVGSSDVLTPNTVSYPHTEAGRPMKIALCYPSVLPQRGGCETYIARLCHRLVCDGHEVHLFAWRWDAKALPAELCFHPIELPLRPRFLRPWYFTYACREQLRRTEHDVSIGFDKIAGVDVYYPQGGDYEASVTLSLSKHSSRLWRYLLSLTKWLDPAHLSFRALDRRQYNQTDSLVLAISDMVRRHLIEDRGVPADRVVVLPIAAPVRPVCTEAEPAIRQRFRDQWQLPNSSVVALFAGMNYRLKGLVPLLHAMSRLRDQSLHLVVAGQSSHFWFRHLARRLGIFDKVRFIGYCPQMQEAYLAADLLVHPTFYDPCSNVVLEALAYGLPVITTTRNGASELLSSSATPHYGWGRPAIVGACPAGFVLDDPHDDARLAEALAMLLSAERRANCAAAARTLAACWTFEHHYQRLVEILTQARRQSHRRAA